MTSIRAPEFASPQPAWACRDMSGRVAALLGDVDLRCRILMPSDIDSGYQFCDALFP